jgi:glutaryl-CoA dehydrogenase
VPPSEQHLHTTDLFGFSDQLTQTELNKLRALRTYLDEHARPNLARWWEAAECPEHLRKGLADLGLADDPTLLDHSGRLRPLYLGFRSLELARCDLSVAVLYGGQAGMFRTLVREGGSPEQVAKLDPRIATFDFTGCFALTEPDHGSDIAGGMQTRARREGDGWRISGRKRWIGNAAISDVLGVVAADEAGDAKVFLVPRRAPGVSVEDITGKLSLRMVRNGDIVLDDVLVSDDDRLQRINSFADIAAILGSLRPDVAWLATGTQIGAYESALTYATQRTQFGRPIAGFQLIQEKLTRMLGNTTASLAMVVGLAQARERGRGGDTESALVKAWVSDALRETVALGREIAGGEGIRVQHDLARYFADAEAIYTFEGTREINTLIVGKAITGLSAFTR